MNGCSRLLLAGMLMLAACAPPAPGANGPAPADQPTAVVAPADSMDVVEYAQHFGITPEEASRRFEIVDAVGSLQAELATREADTFAGLWLEHEPDFRVVVAFTEDGEATIRPYIAGRPYEEYVEVRTHRYSLAELEAAQQEAVAIAEQLDLAVASSISVQENRVELIVGNPDLLLEEVDAAGLGLPEPVEVMAIDPNDLPASNRGEVAMYEGPDGQGIYFPRQPPASAFMEALLEGTLVLDERGCLRVADGTGEAPLVIWHHDFGIRIEGDGIEVLDGEGQVVGRLGERIRMGGGESSLGERSELRVDACPGPYWILGQIESLEAQAIPDIIVDPFTVNGAILALVYQQSRPAPEEGVLSGELRVDGERCLRVAGYVVLWPPGVWPREHAGSLWFVRVEGDREEIVARVGEAVRLPGAERTPDDYRFFENKIRCQGPYWGAAGGRR